MKNLISTSGLMLMALFLSLSLFTSCDDDLYNETVLSEPDAATTNVNIYYKQQMHKVTTWGHDIKQGGKAARLTNDACKTLFVNNRFNLLRIPIYCNSHNANGSVKSNNQYGPIIAAIKRAKNNGNPQLYASVKIYWPEDKSITNNDTWGPFLKSDGLIHATNYAKCLDAYIAYIKQQTGLTVKYLAPVCEQHKAVPTYKFRQICERKKKNVTIVKNQPKIITW